MIASDNLVFVIKAGMNGKGNNKYCLYYEDSKIVQYTEASSSTYVSVVMSYDGKKNEPNYDDQLKLYATFDEGSCSLLNIWREKKSVPVLEG
jgi:hypothetical protein